MVTHLVYKFTRYCCIPLVVLTMVMYGCNSVSVTNEEEQEQTESGESWLVAEDEIFRGAGRDEIASIDEPSFSKPGDIQFMRSDDLVFGLKVGDEVKAYPHKILNYHEIVNDVVGGEAVVVTFCPLTGSGIAWNRTINNQTTTFGVSGFIYKNNLIAYDRSSDNHWSQMQVRSIRGTYKGNTPTKIYHNLVSMTWDSWKKAFPNSEVLNTKGKALAGYPYGEDFDEDNENILFPIKHEDDRLERKNLGHGIEYGSSLIVFPINTFAKNTSVVNTQTRNNDVVVAGKSTNKLAVSFYRTVDDGTTLQFSRTDTELPIVMTDNEGNSWNIFGEAMEGPRSGQTLEPVPSYNAYWYAWVDFYGASVREPLIHNGDPGF